MKRTRNWPEETWHFNFGDVVASQTDRCDDMIALMGVVALDRNGQQRAPFDLACQLEITMNELEMILRGAEADLASVVKLAAFYVGGKEAEEEVRRAVLARFDADAQPLLTCMPVDDLAFPGMMIEIDGFAFAHEDGSAQKRFAPAPGMLGSGARLYYESSGAEVNPHDTFERQCAAAVTHLRRSLEAANAAPEDVAQVYVYYASSEETKDWKVAGDALATAFGAKGPAVSFIPLPRLGGPHRIELDATLVVDGSARTDTELAPWPWPGDWPFVHALRRGDAVFVSGQLALDEKGRAPDPGQMVPQTRMAMENIVKLLGSLGATYNHVNKVQCWYNGAASVDALTENAMIRSSYMTKPGGTSTGVPVPYSPHPDCQIQIDVQAMISN